MDLIERIGEAIGSGYDKEKKSLLINLYHEAFPLAEKLPMNCTSCGVTAFNKLLYLYNKSNTMAKSNKYQIKNGGEVVVFPKLNLKITNESLNDSVVAMLQKKLGADFANHFELVNEKAQ